MKKILFASAFALIGTFALANETNKKETEKKSEKVEEIITLSPCSSWRYEETSCGNNYYLCNDHYESGERDLLEDLIYFEIGKC